MKQKLLFTAISTMALTAVCSAVEVGYWSFNEGTGSFVGDSSGYGHAGTLVNGTQASWVTGINGSALYFPGQTGGAGTRVDISDSALLRLSNSGSFAAWIFSEDIGRDAPILAKEGPGGLSYWFGTYGPSGAGHWGVLMDQNGSYNWDLDGRNRGNAPGGRWTHLAATWNGSTVRYYVDGGLEGTGAWNGTIFGSNAKLTIGMNSDWLTTAFRGAIDEVHLYDHAISDNDVARLAAVPEPASFMALGVGLAALLARKRR